MRARWAFVLSVLLASAVAAGQSASPILIKGVRVVSAPGRTIESTDILMRHGVIAEIGSGISAPHGAEIVDGAGLTAYPGFIHPFLKVAVEGVVPSTQGLTPAQLMEMRDKDPFNVRAQFLSRIQTGELSQPDTGSLSSLAKAGYGMAQVFASGGIVGTRGDVLSLGTGEIGPKAVVAPGRGVALTLAARGFTGYPNSQMGVIAFARQTLYDAQRYSRMKSAWEADPRNKPRPERDLGFDGLQGVVAGTSHAFFDDLSEATAYQAMSLTREFGLKPVYAFRQNAGWLSGFLKSSGSPVLLRGEFPSRPTLGADNARNSIGSVRSYFNELQAAAELERSGIAFMFAPATTGDPLGAIRTYVRAGLSREAALAALTTRPAALLRVERIAGTLEEGKLANLVLMQGDLFETSSQLMAVYVEGRKVTAAMPARKRAEDLRADAPLKLMKPNYEPFPRPAETSAAHRLYRNATVWTMGPKGILANADVLIRNGKIVAVGKGLQAPAGAQVVDATGKHISPGIWDCHSHTGINGSVNEGSNMVTVECRIQDVIEHRDISIYQQLGGGTVGAQQLHGSANVIGGQSNPVKWRWGLPPTEFRIAGAPEGVKFALGQNPIREDSGGFGQAQQPEGTTLLTWRPRTRMGNEESIRRALNLGVQYGKEWEAFRSGKTSVEPRRDLQLEGLWEIVSGKRYIHSHGYRADELLMLVRVAKEYGAKIRTLQHVLEGYKIADEMAEQGIGGSTFSDWWGYKLEAYDAIPHNAALMAQRGVSVSVNSDSDNHARRLNIEAAKSIRYGGVSPEKALSFVTIEPARQMGIDRWTGSLEPGKDADMVVWTADPTSIFAICLETYVDGVKRFDLEDDAKQRQERLAELEEARNVLAVRAEPADPGLSSGDEEPKAAVSGIGTVAGLPGSAKYPRKPVHIVGATIHPMAGEPLVGDVLIGSDGLIAAVGKVTAPAGSVRVDGKGKHVYPGIVDAATSLGLTEIGQVPASDDSSERGDFHPDYRAARALNPDSELIAAARNQGVLTALTAPAGSGFAGQAALLSLEGYTWEDLVIEGGLALRVSLGGGRRFGGSRHVDDGHGHGDEEATAGIQGRRGGGEGPTASAMLTRISSELKKAREYRDAMPNGNGVRDDRYETLLLAAEGKLPFLVEATSAADMKAAVEWAEKEKVAIQLTGCSAASEIAEWLATKQVPVILTATMAMPSSEGPLDEFYGLAARLKKAGVKFCLASGQSHDVRQIREYAGFSARHGLSAEDSVRAITQWPAEILGMGKRLGVVAPGYEGTVILTDGILVEPRTQILRAWIRGRECEMAFRQTRLYDKYRTRPAPGNGR
jgi:imidazolonepropionase-like amidohydrolase